MATIIKRGSKYMALVRREGFKPVSKTFGKRSDATAWGRVVEGEMSAGCWVEATPSDKAPTVAVAAESVPTMLEALKTYRATVVEGLKGASTYAYWLDELERSPMALKLVNVITPGELSAWRDEQSQGRVAGTVARKLGLLSGFFTWCHKDREWITGNPLKAVRKPRANDARSRVITDDERAFLLAVARTGKAPWLADVLTVLLQSAMRRGELAGMKRGAVDYAQSTAYLADSKNGHSRSVPLCPVALAALRRLEAAALARGSESLVPVSDPHAVSLAFRRTVARAKAQYLNECAASGTVGAIGFLDGLHLHDARHTAVTAWATTGQLSTAELQGISGHRDLRSLGRYTHLKASTIAGKLAGLSVGVTA